MATMHSSARRLFAVVPAAGRSRRMGQPKLLMPLGQTTVIGRLLQTLSTAGISPFVLIRPGDEALDAEVARTTASRVVPHEAPEEMRHSVEELLRTVTARHAPTTNDGWLLIPADHPFTSVHTLRRLVETWRDDPTSIVLPTCEGRRGHPTILPWSLAQEVFELPAGVGINQLVRRHENMVRELDVDDSSVHFDLDTPADYERARQLLAE